MKHEASFWKPLDGKKVQCNLCVHSCKINENGFGICGVRQNIDGKLFTLIYGSCSSMAVDPIEKKPLYHFHPGTSVFSLGTIGCNLKCRHCQNNSISTAGVDFPHMKEFTPEQTVELIQEKRCQGIAWTYNEPTIWHEFAYDTSKLVKRHGLYTVYVSNGFIQEDPLREISPYLDAINVDVKAFTDNFYKKVCKARLEPVLRTCELVKELGIHLEVTYLVIPTYNDSTDEITRFCNWVVETLGKDVPVHFSRFHPDYMMTDVPITPIETLQMAYNIAKKTGVLYPYIGNVPYGSYENTICPTCGNLCIERYGYSVDQSGMKNGKCVNCDAKINLVL